MLKSALQFGELSNIYSFEFTDKKNLGKFLLIVYIFKLASGSKAIETQTLF